MEKNVYLLLYFFSFWNEAPANQIPSRFRHVLVHDLSTEFESGHHRQGFRNEMMTSNHAAGSPKNPLFTKWSPWSRCEDCLQRRMKKCISPKCKQSKLYEERPCPRRRCQRRRRGQVNGDFRIIHVDDDMRKGGASLPGRTWTKWSKWSKCSQKCRTYRYRMCRKPEKCKKRKRQKQGAYCYHDNSRCERYVLDLMDTNSRRIDTTRYEYNNKPPQVQSTDERVNVKKPNCGRARRKTKMLKIIGGKEAKKYKWPWHVAVINRYREVFCAGTLIAPRWILTAGHCVRSYLRVRLNEHDLSSIDGRELELTVQKVFTHPRFNHQTVDNDIALLRLPRAVSLTPVCLPITEPESEEMCSVMGWGKLNSSDEYGSTVLHEAKIPVVPWVTCTRSYKKYFLTTNMFCAGWASGIADTCAGDSGGGLMCPSRNGTKPNRYSIQGITSFGDGCGRRNKYGIYTMVFNYLGWINYIIETYS
uniref:limulus clotting factor C n=2 Tax=Photinus pyralis TaxID=7054 RepID=A0A1Y1KKA9_PHOPY